MIVVLLAGLFRFQEPTAQQLVDQFRSDRVEERDHASRDLRRLGEAARTLLEKASRDLDAEVARRTRDILDSLDAEAAATAFRTLQADLDQAVAVRVKVVGSGEQYSCLTAGSSSFKYETLFLREPGKPAAAEGTRWLLGAKDPREPFRLTFDDVQTPLTVSTGILHLENNSLRRTWSRSSSRERPWSCQVSEFRGGADERGRTLAWRAQWKDPAPVDVRVKLWLDPTSRRPLMRTVETRIQEGTGSGATVTETFEEFQLTPAGPKK